MHDGREGFWRAREQSYDVVVLDIMLRGEGVTTPILMLMATDGEYDEAQGLDTGADDHLTDRAEAIVRAREAGLGRS